MDTCSETLNNPRRWHTFEAGLTDPSQRRCPGHETGSLRPQTLASQLQPASATASQRLPASQPCKFTSFQASWKNKLKICRQMQNAWKIKTFIQETRLDCQLITVKTDSLTGGAKLQMQSLCLATLLEQQNKRRKYPVLLHCLIE